MNIQEGFAKVFFNSNSYRTNHYAYEPIQQENTSKWDILQKIQYNVHYYASHTFPIISVFHEPTGLFLRSITDVRNLANNKTFFALVKTMLSAASLTGSNLSEARKELSYLKQIELIRTIVVRAETIYKVWSDPTSDLWGLKKFQQGLHLFIDLINMRILYSNQKLLDLRLFSLILQLGATVLDFKEQQFEKSYLGMGVQSIIGLMRMSSIMNVASELRDDIRNSDRIEVLYPEKSPLSRMVAHMNEMGTASEELNKFQVIKHLGNERQLGDLFLVKDENDQTFVMRRFFSATELAEKYMKCNIRLAQDLAEPIAEKASRTASEISENVSDSNLIKVVKVIKNSYTKVCEKTKESETQTDTYLLMEHFEGTPIDKLDPANSHFPAYFQSIVNTLVKISGLDYFFDPMVGTTIQVDPTSNQVKFTSFTHFHKLIQDSNSWKACVMAYDSMYSFFSKLISLSGQKNKEEMLEKLKRIFNYLALVKQYLDFKNPISKEALKQCSEIFTIEFLKNILKQVQELFSLPEAAE